jgi:hypothetical protein
VRWQRNAPALPINAVNRNLIFARGSVAGVYRADSVNYGLLSIAEKQGLQRDLFWWMITAEASFSIYRVCREYPADDYVRDTVSMIDERYADRRDWEQMLERQSAHMRSMRSFVPEVYPVVSLPQSMRLPWNHSQRDVKSLHDAGATALGRITDHLAARNATTRELQWLLRRAAVRGVREPNVDPHWIPPALSLDGGVWNPGRADVQSFMPIVTRRGRSVLVEGEDGDSLQTFLVLGRPPKTSDFPGNAELLFAPLESLDFPVDAVAHTSLLNNKKMLSICDDAVKDANDELQEAVHRFLDKKTSRRVQEVVEVQDYFASEPYPPGLDTFICFAVGAPADKPELLEQRVTRLEQAYGSMALYRPRGLQREMFEEHMLRPDGLQMNGYRRDYRRLLIAEQYAAMMPIGTNQGGSRTGIYIGHTAPGARRPVKYDMLEASATNKAGAVALNGTLGGGKTIAGELLFTHAIRRGSIGVDVDPRPDHELEKLLGRDRVHSISLENSDENVGRLDPLVVAPPQMREELAVSYMIDLLPTPVPEWQTEIIDAVRYVLREPDPSSLRVLEVLLAGGVPSDDRDDAAYTAARAAGRSLRTWSTWGLCRLAFGDGESAPVDLAKQATTIKVAGLSLPPAGTPRSDYDQSERISVATFKLIVAYSMRLLSGDVSTHKILMLDEVHAFSDTADGQRFLSRVLRMARSMNVTVLLLTQLLGDLERLKDLIGVVMAFRQQSPDQAKANLRMMELDEDNQDLVERLLSFENGMCLMRGLDGRVIQMQVDPADPDFLAVADTNPARPRERQEIA